MARFIIEGGKSLAGELTPQGAKNEALQVICATLLTDKTVTISNIPEIRDVIHLRVDDLAVILMIHHKSSPHLPRPAEAGDAFGLCLRLAEGW